MANLTIKTTQNIEINFIAATLAQRILAFLLDSVFKFLYMVVVFFIVSYFNLIKSLDVDVYTEYALWFFVMLPIVIYSFFFEATTQGTTPGKKIMKIKVLKIDGYQADLGDYFIRWILRVVDIVGCWGIVAIISVIFTKDSQRIGDILAATTVISLKERVNLSASIYQEIEEEYVPKIPQVVKLSDTDIGVIKDIYTRYLRNRDFTLLKSLVSKLELELGVDKQDVAINNEEFVRLILKDYNHFTGRE